MKKHGLGLAAVSYDSVEVLKHFAARRKLSFPLLSDSDSSVIRLYGLLNEKGAVGTPFFGYPHPVTLIADAKGVLRSKHFEEDYRNRFTVANILAGRLGVRVDADRREVAAKHIRITTSSSNALVRAGERIRLFLDLAMPRKMHVYAPGVRGYIPIEWSMGEPAPWKSLPVQYPAAKELHLRAIKETALVYDRTVKLEREIVLGQPKELGESREIVIRGSLRYQACDDRVCHAPETVPLEWRLQVESYDSTRVPVELRRK